MDGVQRQRKTKTIIRRTMEDRKAAGFTIIDPRIITDTSLSKTARILYAYALTKPDNWIFNATNISEELLGKEDRKAIRNALDELRERKLAIGHFSRPPVIFLEKPYSEMNREEREQVDSLLLETHPEYKEHKDSHRQSAGDQRGAAFPNRPKVDPGNRPGAAFLPGRLHGNPRRRGTDTGEPSPRFLPGRDQRGEPTPARRFVPLADDQRGAIPPAGNRISAPGIP